MIIFGLLALASMTWFVVRVLDAIRDHADVPAVQPNEDDIGYEKFLEWNRINEPKYAKRGKLIDVPNKTIPLEQFRKALADYEPEPVTFSPEGIIQCQTSDNSTEPKPRS